MNGVSQHLLTSFAQRRTLLVSIFVFLASFSIEVFICILMRMAPALPLLLMLSVLDLLLAFFLGWFLAEPLAIRAYLRDVGREQKKKRQLYTPLSGAQNLYETPTDPANQKGQNFEELLRQKTYLLILGLPGAGKTMVLQVYQSLALRQTWRLMWGQGKIPVYAPLKDYNAFLERSASQKQNPSLPYPPSLLAYLLDNDALVGMKHLQPYLEH